MDAEAGCRRSANGMIYGATSEFTQVTPRLFVPIVIVIALSCCSSKRRRSATRYHFIRAEGFHTAEPPFCGDGGMAGTMRAGCGFIRKQRNRRFASEMRASNSMVAEEGAELLSQP